MDSSYVVGFKDVYPWLWSIMLGVAITLAERRGAFMPHGATTTARYYWKNLVAVIFNVGMPSVVFGITMIRLGPLYSPNMDFWQMMGALYLAGAPLGAHHGWLAISKKCGWLPADAMNQAERDAHKLAPQSHLVWVILAFGIPAFAAIVGWRFPF